MGIPRGVSLKSPHTGDGKQTRKRGYRSPNGAAGHTNEHTARSRAPERSEGCELRWNHKGMRRRTRRQTDRGAASASHPSRSGSVLASGSAKMFSVNFPDQQSAHVCRESTHKQECICQCPCVFRRDHGFSPATAAFLEGDPCKGADRTSMHAVCHRMRLGVWTRLCCPTCPPARPRCDRSLEGVCHFDRIDILLHEMRGTVSFRIRL